MRVGFLCIRGRPWGRMIIYAQVSQMRVIVKGSCHRRSNVGMKGSSRAAACLSREGKTRSSGWLNSRAVPYGGTAAGGKEL
jgi:hypothetical protein